MQRRVVPVRNCVEASGGIGWAPLNETLTASDAALRSAGATRQGYRRGLQPQTVYMGVHGAIVGTQTADGNRQDRARGVNATVATPVKRCRPGAFDVPHLRVSARTATVSTPSASTTIARP